MELDKDLIEKASMATSFEYNTEMNQDEVNSLIEDLLSVIEAKEEVIRDLENSWCEDNNPAYEYGY